MRKRILMSLLLLSSCASHGPFDESSRFFAIPTGSTLVLNQTIEIASDQVSVYMQDGRLSAYSLMNQYQPHCKFEVYTIADHPRRVEPDSFLVTRVEDYTETSSLQPVTVAALDMALGLTMGGDIDGPTIVTYSTMIYLSSRKQPDVYRMTCMHWDEISRSRYLTINEMRKAMGDIFSLQINPALTPEQGA